MFDLKIIAFIPIFILIISSCKPQRDRSKLPTQAGTTNTQNLKPDKKDLIPYSKIYYSPPPDTILANGIYLLNLVNRDTTDQTLYLKYGNKGFDSILIIEYGVNQSPCHNYEFCYSTLNSIGIIYQCMNSRSLTILPLIKTKPVIEHLNPVYIGIKQGIIITLMNGDGDQDNGDSLLISDLDFIKKQYIKIKGLVGADRRFDKIEIKGNLLHLNYTGWVPNSAPETIDQMAKIKLSNSPYNR